MTDLAPLVGQLSVSDVAVWGWYHAGKPAHSSSLTHMLCPTRCTPLVNPWSLKNSPRSSAMATLVCGAACGDCPWFRMSSVNTRMDSALAMRLPSDRQFCFDPLSQGVSSFKIKSKADKSR